MTTRMRHASCCPPPLPQTDASTCSQLKMEELSRRGGEVLPAMAQRNLLVVGLSVRGALRLVRPLWGQNYQRQGPIREVETGGCPTLPTRRQAVSPPSWGPPSQRPKSTTLRSRFPRQRSPSPTGVPQTQWQHKTHRNTPREHEEVALPGHSLPGHTAEVESPLPTSDGINSTSRFLQHRQ